MTHPAPFDLYGRAQSLLDLVVAGFTDRNIGLPEVRYVGPGQQVAYDGEQVTASVLHIRPGKPEASTQFEPAGFMEQAAGYAVAVVRETPVGSADGTPPSADALSASAKQNLVDVTTMWDVLIGIRDAGSWVDKQTPWAITEVRTEGPQGGVVACVGLIAVTLI